MQGKSRRRFIQGIAGISGVASTARGAAASGDSRTQTALAMRQNAAAFQLAQPPAKQTPNNDEAALPNYIGSFTKGLPHDQLGLIDPNAYASLLRALDSGKSADFEAIIRGSGMKLVNPQSAFAYELDGADPHRFASPPAPSLSSAEAAAEMVELYWQALARDIPFAAYADSPLVQAAVQDIAGLSAFQGPSVSTSSVFRGPFAGCLDGPYLSQYLWKPIPLNSSWMEQRYRIPIGNFLTTYAEWIVIQSGIPPFRDYVFDPTPRYITTGRGLAEWVHYDFLYQAFHNAALILLNQTPESILNTNQYYALSNPYKNSRLQTGFATFGAPQICAWLGRATTAALEAAWYQKWCVHRRLRPEEFGGWAHLMLSGSGKYPLHSDLLNSTVLPMTQQANGSYLLSQVFPEGAPLHPSYPAGHATVAGACSALLKAFFDENGLLTDCVAPNADGTALVPYEDTALTVGGELNKLAFNIAIGRNFAGIHYRSDAMAGFRLGEEVAIAKLQDWVNTMTEDFGGFQFTRMDGTLVKIGRQ